MWAQGLNQGWRVRGWSWATGPANSTALIGPHIPGPSSLLPRATQDVPPGFFLTPDAALSQATTSQLALLPLPPSFTFWLNQNPVPSADPPIRHPVPASLLAAPLPLRSTLALSFRLPDSRAGHAQLPARIPVTWLSQRLPGLSGAVTSSSKAALARVRPPDHLLPDPQHCGRPCSQQALALSFYHCRLGLTVIFPLNYELPEGSKGPVTAESRPAVRGTVGPQTPVERPTPPSHPPPPPQPLGCSLSALLSPRTRSLQPTARLQGSQPDLSVPSNPLPSLSFFVPCPAGDAQPDGPPQPPGSHSACRSRTGEGGETRGLTCHTGEPGWADSGEDS